MPTSNFKIDSIKSSDSISKLKSDINQLDNNNKIIAEFVYNIIEKLLEIEKQTDIARDERFLELISKQLNININNNLNDFFSKLAKNNNEKIDLKSIQNTISKQLNDIYFEKTSKLLDKKIKEKILNNFNINSKEFIKNIKKDKTNTYNEILEMLSDKQSDKNISKKHSKTTSKTSLNSDNTVKLDKNNNSTVNTDNYSYKTKELFVKEFFESNKNELTSFKKQHDKYQIQTSSFLKEIRQRINFLQNKTNSKPFNKNNKNVEKLSKFSKFKSIFLENKNIFSKKIKSNNKYNFKDKNTTKIDNRLSKSVEKEISNFNKINDKQINNSIASTTLIGSKFTKSLKNKSKSAQKTLKTAKHTATDFISGLLNGILKYAVIGPMKLLVGLFKKIIPSELRSNALDFLKSIFSLVLLNRNVLRVIIGIGVLTFKTLIYNPIQGTINAFSSLKEMFSNVSESLSSITKIDFWKGVFNSIGDNLSTFFKDIGLGELNELFEKIQAFINDDLFKNLIEFFNDMLKINETISNNSFLKGMSEAGGVLLGGGLFLGKFVKNPLVSILLPLLGVLLVGGAMGIAHLFNGEDKDKNYLLTSTLYKKYLGGNVNETLEAAAASLNNSKKDIPDTIKPVAGSLNNLAADIVYTEKLLNDDDDYGLKKLTEKLRIQKESWKSENILNVLKKLLKLNAFTGVKDSTHKIYINSIGNEIKKYPYDDVTRIKDMFIRKNKILLRLSLLASNPKVYADIIKDEDILKQSYEYISIKNHSLDNGLDFLDIKKLVTRNKNYKTIKFNLSERLPEKKFFENQLKLLLNKTGDPIKYRLNEWHKTFNDNLDKLQFNDIYKQVFLKRSLGKLNIFENYDKSVGNITGYTINIRLPNNKNISILENTKHVAKISKIALDDNAYKQIQDSFLNNYEFTGNAGYINHLLFQLLDNNPEFTKEFKNPLLEIKLDDSPLENTDFSTDIAGFLSEIKKPENKQTENEQLLADILLTILNAHKSSKSQ